MTTEIGQTRRIAIAARLKRRRAVPINADARLLRFYEQFALPCQAQFVVRPLGQAFFADFDRGFFDDFAIDARLTAQVMNVPAEGFEQRRYEFRTGLGLVIACVAIIVFIPAEALDQRGNASASLLLCCITIGSSGANFFLCPVRHA